MTRIHTPLAAAVLAALVIGPAAHAAIIYSDNFTSGTNGSISGQAPQIAPDDETWTGTWTKNTSAPGTLASGNSSVVLPMPAFEEGDIYTVTARVYNNLASTSTSWIAMGFTSGTTATFNTAGVGSYWMLWRGNDQLRALGSGASFLGPDDVSPAGEDNVLDLRMVFDVDANTMTWLYKNPSATDWTSLHSVTASSSIVNAINNVGFSSTTTGVGVLSLEVTNIPEPASLALMGLGSLLILGRRRQA